MSFLASVRLPLLVAFLLLVIVSSAMAWNGFADGYSSAQNGTVLSVSGDYNSYQIWINLALNPALTNGTDMEVSFYNITAGAEQNISFCRKSNPTGGNVGLWNASSASGRIAVLIPYLANNTPTTVTVYYGKAGSSDNSNCSATFPLGWNDLTGTTGLNLGTASATATTDGQNFTSAATIQVKTTATWTYGRFYGVVRSSGAHGGVQSFFALGDVDNCPNMGWEDFVHASNALQIKDRAAGCGTVTGSTTQPDAYGGLGQWALLAYNWRNDTNGSLMMSGRLNFSIPPNWDNNSGNVFSTATYINFYQQAAGGGNIDLEADWYAIATPWNMSEPVYTAATSSSFIALNITVLINSSNETESVPIVANVTLVGGSGLTFNQTNITGYYNNTEIIKWMVGNNFCFQDNATNTTSCGGLNTGSYACNSGWVANGCANAHDSVWTTFGEPSLSGVGSQGGLDINYSTPSWADNLSLWQVRDGSGTLFLNIPQQCWNQTRIQLEVTTDLTGTTYDCWDFSANHYIIITTTSSYLFFEEAMNWHNSSITTFNNTISTLSAIAPLVPTSSTNIPWNVTVTALLSNGTVLTNSSAGNQRVDEWYNISTLTRTRALPYAVEGNNSIIIGLPALPSHASTAPTYLNYSYTLPICQYFFGNGTDVNATCPSQPTGNLTIFGIPATHASTSTGYIFMDNWGNRSYNLTFSATPESTSRKNFSSVFNATREYFAWVVNSTGQPINGSLNLSYIYNVTFFDEITLAAISIDSAAQTFTTHFPDGTLKNFTIGYSGSGTVQNASVRGYPNFYTANMSSFEVYSKASYATRSKFMMHSPMSFGAESDASVYLLPLNASAYGIINVLNAGSPVSSAYVQILKYYATSGLYTNIDQKITNSNGQAGGYYAIDAFYKFAVYDSAGNTLYTSPLPTQFVYVSSAYQVTIDISNASATDYTLPNVAMTCYGVNATNTIVFSYADATGKTSLINFLAWRSSNQSGAGNVVCNSTVSASSSSYTCNLTALGTNENMSKYQYTCSIRRVASPLSEVFWAIIDFRHWLGLGDWGIIALTAVVAAGVAGTVIHPVVGVGAAAIMLYSLAALQYINLSIGAMVWLLVVAAIVVYQGLRE